MSVEVTTVMSMCDFLGIHQVILTLRFVDALEQFYQEILQYLDTTKPSSSYKGIAI